jgi:hypothetical protein
MRSTHTLKCLNIFNWVYKFRVNKLEETKPQDLFYIMHTFQLQTLENGILPNRFIAS